MTESIIFLLTSIPICISDIKTQKIPDAFTLLSLSLLTLYRVLATKTMLWLYLLTALLAPLFLMIIRFVSKKGLGWGDVKYGSACGMYAGPLAVFLGFFFAALLAALVITIQKKWHSDKAIAFAPFITAGTLLAGILFNMPFFSILTKY